MATVHELLLPRPRSDKERDQLVQQYEDALKRTFSSPDGETVLRYWVDECCMSSTASESHEALMAEKAKREFVLEILHMTRGDEK